MFKKLVVGLTALMIISVVFTMPAAARDKIINIDGSSTVYPIAEAVAEEFTKLKKGEIRVTVGISGTGGGFAKFCRGETDMANASRPIRKSEMDLCKANGIEYIELPIAIDGIAVTVNPKNNWVESMTVDELKKIWEPAASGKVTRWNHVRAAWPNAPLNLYGPGVDSGTFDYFTEAIVGKAKSSRGDFTSSEDDNVLVMGVARDRNALGYFGLAYYKENKDRLKIVPIVNPKTGKAVIPSEKTIMDGTYHPLSRPLFAYISKKAVEKPEVKEFVAFYLKNAAKLVREVKFVPLSAEAYTLATERFEKKKTGTMFQEGRVEIGVKIEDLLKR